MVTLIAMLLAQYPEHRLFLQPNLPRSSAQALAAFEFAPANGAGMPAACSCTSPVAATGQVLTFTRASSGTCLKSNTLADIANGDLVTCSTNEPRVGTGGSGALKLLMEGARTNSTLQSEKFENAAWTKAGSVVAAPTVTANQAIGPDGALTADRVQFAACAGSGFSIIHQAGCVGASDTRSVFIKGVSGSGAIALNHGSGGAANCAFVAGSWTRCITNTGNATTILLGNNCAGGETFAAADVYLIGAQCEAGAFASSYIATEGTAVTRAADAASFAYTAAGGTFSGAATWISPATLASNVLLHLYKDANNSTKLSIASSKVRGTYRIGGSDSTQDTAGNATASAANVTATYYDLTNKAACLAGVCTTGAASLTLATGSMTLYLGADQAGANQAFGWVGQVCADPSASRCR